MDDPGAIGAAGITALWSLKTEDARIPLHVVSYRNLPEFHYYTLEVTVRMGHARQNFDPQSADHSVICGLGVVLFSYLAQSAGQCTFATNWSLCYTDAKCSVSQTNAFKPSESKLLHVIGAMKARSS
jgi:hypothetical protein